MAIPRPLQRLINQLKAEIEAMTRDLEGDQITPIHWQREMERALARYHQAAVMAGNGRPTMNDAQREFVRETVKAQLDWLNQFELQIVGEREWQRGWNARAKSYADSIKVPYWKGRVNMLPLPAMPAQGTQCHCITTPHSRVATRRGLVPIAGVRVGDLAWTHRQRWRPVTRVYRPRVQPGMRQMYVRGVFGEMIGCTDEHRWLTPDGWQNTICIHNGQLLMYTETHENMRYLQSLARQSQPDRLVRGVPESVSKMRLAEGSTGNVVPLMREHREHHATMGGSIEAGADTWPGEGGAQGAPDNARQAHNRDTLAIQNVRWSSLHMVLGWRRQANDLSLSVDVDQGAWANTEASSYPSHQRRLHGRPSRESGMSGSLSASFVSHDRGSQAQDGAGERENIYRQVQLRPAADMDMQDMRKDVSRLPQEWCYRPQVLLAGMLPEGSLLFDLEVEDDHSFVIEGIITHNSNCKCSWEVVEVDADAGDYDAYWRRASDDSCQSCLEREARWSPVRIRGGVLQL